MDLLQMVQMLNSLAAIAIIMVGSAWLKQSLKGSCQCS